jgi:DNA-binding response OmpR family regulator
VEAARDQDEVLVVGDVEVRPADGLVVAGGQVLALSVRELEVLLALMRRSGTIVQRDELYSLVWGAELRRGDRSVDVYVHNHRVKLESALPGWHYIHTHFGFGYRLAPEPSHPFHIPATGP